MEAILPPDTERAIHAIGIEGRIEDYKVSQDRGVITLIDGQSHGYVFATPESAGRNAKQKLMRAEHWYIESNHDVRIVKCEGIHAFEFWKKERRAQ